MNTVRRSRPPAGRRLRDVVLAALVLLVSGCMISAPAVDTWRSDAADALEAVASELATVELALGSHQRDELFEATMLVLLVRAEDAADTAAADFSALQPPPEHDAEREQLTAALDDAVALLTQARIAVAAQQTSPVDQLVADLSEERSALTELAEQLR